MGPSAATDIWTQERLSVDFGSQYKISDAFSVYFNAKNLTNTALKLTEGPADNRVIQHESTESRCRRESTSNCRFVIFGVASQTVSMADIHDAAQRGFAGGAAYYSRGRPGYPEEILKWLQTQLRLAPGKQALELGAGTGKFTRCLSLTGAQIYVVEPVPAMLSHLQQDVPSAWPVPGSAEAIGIEASRVDAVVCAQSFHWFATRETLTEIARVLKPGGVLGLVNIAGRVRALGRRHGIDTATL